MVAAEFGQHHIWAKLTGRIWPSLFGRIWPILEVWGPEGWGAQHLAFFFLSPAKFVLSSLSEGVTRGICGI